jgi:hypothetical protein
MDEQKMDANSELRFIAMELTKIAEKRKRPFKAVAAEYIHNVYELDEMLRSTPPARSAVRRARSAASEDEQE